MRYVLSLNKCVFYLYKGVHNFEKLFGQYYNLDAVFHIDCDYGNFHSYCSLYKFMRRFVYNFCFEYIEELCYLLCVSFLNKFSFLACVEVCVSKPVLLMGGILEKTYVLIRIHR
ncbi:7,8-dihydroneopterin aldolase [Candidatus Hodgkinia cicadicola]|nr:7,8-dihydroneopterin aldolase [Candidatus Hodgkinia cicadicola]